MNGPRRNIPTLLLALVLLAATAAHGGEIRLSAAASLTEAARELIATFEARRPEVTVQANFGSSGALAKQIAQGAPVDLFVSAHSEWLALLAAEGRVMESSVRVLATNALVFVGRPGSRVSALGELPTLERVAMGSPQSVPAGRYAEQAMRAAGVYQEMRRGNKLVLAKDVRQALLYAERGEVDGAFVYQSDALLARQAALLFTVPADLHEPITCPMALTAEGGQKPEAVAFHQFLQGPEAAAILERHGFSPPRPVAGPN